MNSEKTEHEPLMISLVYEHDADTRVLVRFDAANDDLPIELFNNDDMMPLSNPPVGSALRNGILSMLRMWWLDNLSVESIRKTVTQ